MSFSPAPRSEHAYPAPWDDPAARPAEPSDPAPNAAPGAPRRRGRRPLAARPSAGDAAPVWLYHHLTVSGPAEPVAAFAAAARGAGVIPWRLDTDRIEEDLFHLAAAQPAGRRTLSIAGCHTLARQFRARVEAHHARAVAQVGRAQNCPFDLHALLPVPGDILALGSSHPDALAWLAAHWGITDRLRQVAERPATTTGRRLPRGHAVVGYGFFTAGDIPHAAIASLAARWPALRFFGPVPRPAG